MPKRCSANSPNRISTLSGTIQASSPGAAIFSPSTADNTEIAGVITLSPKNNAAPASPAITAHQRSRGRSRNARCASASSAMIPPSPLLCARMMNRTYFSDTTPTSDQNASDSTPSTLSAVGATPCLPKASCSAYSGLVAMSPKTMPSAAMASTGNRCRACAADGSASALSMVACMVGRRESSAQSAVAARKMSVKFAAAFAQP